MRFHFSSLKLWLILRYNPSSTTIYGKPKMFSARLLDAKEFRQNKVFDCPNAFRGRVLGIVGDFAARIPKRQRIGVLASGGIDSSTIVACLVKLGYSPELITIGFGASDDEVTSAQTVAKHFNLKHHTKIITDPLDCLAEANRLLPEPNRTAGYVYQTYQFARSLGFSHVFDGLGPDEFLGGYTFRYDRIRALMDKGAEIFSAYVRGAHPLDAPNDLMFLGEKLRHVPLCWRCTFPELESDLPLLDKIMHADYNNKCRHNFIPLGKLGKAAHIYLHYPFLCDEWINLCLQVPTELKDDKAILRSAFHGDLPESTVNKEKQGFSANLSLVWPTLKTKLDLDSWLFTEGYLNRGWYAHALDIDQPSPLEVNKVWDAYTLAQMVP